MKKKTYSNSDIKEKLSQKLDFYENFFNDSLPALYLLDKDPLEIREQYIKVIEDYQVKGKKILKVAQTMHQLCEIYFKNLKDLENYKESAEYQIERLEVAIEESELITKVSEKTIENLNAYIEDVEKNYEEVSVQRDKYKKELQGVKEYTKNLEHKLNKSLTEEKQHSLKVREEDLKKIEGIKGELSYRDKCIQELHEKLNRTEKLYTQEKALADKARSNCERMRGEIFELKNKLSEEKLKKSNYKDLYKDLLQVRANKCRNYSVQTVDDLGLEQEDEVVDENNDLFGLEEEQSKAHSVSCSIEIKEAFEGFSADHEKNAIYLIPLKGLEKRRIVKCEEISVERIEKFLEICKNESFSVVCRKKHENRAVLYTVSALQVKNKGKDGKLWIKTRTAEHGAEWIEVQRPANVFSAPVSPKTQVVKVNNWGGDVDKIETPVVEVSQDEPEDGFTQVESERKVESKGLIANFCQSFKASCGYGSIIEPKSIYSNFFKLKEPISAIPGAIQGYLRKN